MEAILKNKIKNTKMIQKQLGNKRYKQMVRMISAKQILEIKCIKLNSDTKMARILSRRYQQNGQKRRY